MHYVREARGYTLVEMLFQLVVVILFAHLLVFIVLWYAKFQDVEAMQQSTNWELFVVDIRDYLAEAKKFSVIQNGQAIQFDVLDEGVMRTFIVEKSATNHIRKRSLLGGNEIMFSHVQAILFTIEGNYLRMELQLVNGQERERIFIVPKIE